MDDFFFITNLKTIFMKYYSLSELQDKFSKLSKLRQIEILWAALDFMQSYNGRSRWLCVAMAMGYDNNEGASDTYYKVSKVVE